MKTFNSFKIVFKKEMKDAFRDKKSIILNFVLPLLLVPIMFIVISLSASGMISSGSNPKVALVSYTDEVSLEKAEMLSPSDEDFNYVKTEVLKAEKDNSGTMTTAEVVAFNSKEELQTALLEGEIGVIVAVPKNVKELVESGGKADIKLIYDEYSTASSIEVSGIRFLINSFHQRMYDQRLEAEGVDKEKLEATSVAEVTGGEFFNIERTGTPDIFLQMMLPMIIVMIICAGGMAMAIDQVAGEKERNTFEPLLSTSANRMGIILAKVVVVLVFSLMSVATELVSILIIIPFMGELVSGTFTISIGGILMCFVNLLLFAGLYNSLLLMLSAMSKNSKEANMKCTFVMFVPMIVALTTMYVSGADVSIASMFIPVINVINMIKMVICGNINYLFFTISIVMNLVYLGIALFVTLKTFSKEKLIART